MIAILEKINEFIWGVPTLVLILSVGVYFSIRTRFAQIKLFPKSINNLFGQIKKSDNADNETSGYRALCTALAATVGTGNLAGVAGAIALGGPGTIFWMWVCAILGMVTKFAEAVLSIRFRSKNKNGEIIGGPMYIIENGLGKRWIPLAMIYCFFGIVASFGVGNATQINTILASVNTVINYCGGEETTIINALIGMFMSGLILMLFLKGARRIGIIAEKLIPFASLFYIFMCAYVLIARFEMLPKALEMIVSGAFEPSAVTGGVISSTFLSLRVGAARGVFTNEAGMGTAGIAHASANVSHPVEQGLMGIAEVFIDTIVICTMTALVILCSEIPIPYGVDTGIQLTNSAFAAVLGGWICIPITIALCCFAIGTILGWGLYGLRCAQYIFGAKTWKKFVYLQAAIVMLGAVLRTGTVWLLSEIVNGLMVIPNLIGLILLSPELFKLIVDYKIRARSGQPSPDKNYLISNLTSPDVVSMDR